MQMGGLDKEVTSEMQELLNNKADEENNLDGKKDDTLELEKDERGIWKVVTYNVEHYTLGIEPGGDYLGHLEPESGKAEEITKSVMKYLRENRIDGGWQVVGSDSTSSITGNVGGCLCSEASAFYTQMNYHSGTSSAPWMVQHLAQIALKASLESSFPW